MRLVLRIPALVSCLFQIVPAIADADNFYIEARGELIAGGSLNLGELVDAAEDSENDLSPVRVGFIGGLGYQRGHARFGIDAGFGSGGLDLDRIEGVYLDSPRQAVGNTAYLSSGVSSQYLLYQHSNWSIPAGVRMGWARLSAASPAGAASVDFVYAELGVGLSHEFTAAHSVTLAAVAQADRSIYVLLGENGRRQTPVASAWFRQTGLGLFYRLALGK